MSRPSAASAPARRSSSARRTFATAVTPRTKDVITLDWKDGSQDVFATLGEDGAFVDDGYADDHDLTVGSTFPVTFVTGKTRTFTVKGIFDPPTGGSPFGSVTISAATWDAENPQPKDLYTFVKVAGRRVGREPGRAREGARRATRTRRCRRASSSSTTRSRASTRS